MDAVLDAWRDRRPGSGHIADQLYLPAPAARSRAVASQTVSSHRTVTLVHGCRIGVPTCPVGYRCLFRADHPFRCGCEAVGDELHRGWHPAAGLGGPGVGLQEAIPGKRRARPDFLPVTCPWRVRPARLLLLPPRG